MVPSVDTKSASAVGAHVEDLFGRVFGGTSPEMFRRILKDTEMLFAGKHPDYLPIDLLYHDLEHTLQATVCLVRLLANRAFAKATPVLTPRQFELALAGVLLHDSGYLKLRSDTSGTGAKYTFCHVLRSSAFASSYLPTLGVTEAELSGVLGAIKCTGVYGQTSSLRFHDEAERIVGYSLSTADYLSQMAAPDYPDELEILYREFEESDDFVSTPRARRMFKSSADLAARTPDFWSKFVLAKLEYDFQGVYRYLSDPFPDGPNPYVRAIERNLEVIRSRYGQTVRDGRV